LISNAFVSAEALALLNGKEVSTNQCISKSTQFFSLIAAVWEDSYATRGRNDTVNTDVFIPTQHWNMSRLCIFTRKPKGSILSGAGVTYSGNLEHMSSVAKASQSPHMASVLSQIADEIRILATVLQHSPKPSFEESMEKLATDTSLMDTPVQEPVLAIAAERMALVVNAAANYCDDEVVYARVSINHCFPNQSSLVTSRHLYCCIYFAIRLMPPDYDIGGAWRKRSVRRLCPC
jgi:hypothetical protein